MIQSMMTMAINSFLHFSIILFPFIVSPLSGGAAATGFIGINYGSMTDEAIVIELLGSQGPTRFKLYYTDAADPPSSLLFSVPTSQLPSLSPTSALLHCLPLTVLHRRLGQNQHRENRDNRLGNEVSIDPINTTKVPRLSHEQCVQFKHNLSVSIKISSSITLLALRNSSLPSSVVVSIDGSGK